MGEETSQRGPAHSPFDKLRTPDPQPEASEGWPKKAENWLPETRQVDSEVGRAKPPGSMPVRPPKDMRSIWASTLFAQPNG